LSFLLEEGNSLLITRSILILEFASMTPLSSEVSPMLMVSLLNKHPYQRMGDLIFAKVFIVVILS